MQAPRIINTVLDRGRQLWGDAYRPDAFRKGLIVGLLSALPFAFCMLVDEPLFAIFTSLAAVRLGMADPAGGAFAYRLRTMAAGTLCVTLGCYLGTLMADATLWLLPAVFVMVLAFAAMGALGSEGLAISTLTLFLTVVSLGVPGDAEARAGAVFLACLFMIAGLLLPWPLHPDRPVRRAMAAALREVAGLAAAVAAADGDASQERVRARWNARTAAYRALDAALESLSETLPQRRRGVRPTALRQILAAAMAGQRMTRALATLAEYRGALPPQVAAELAEEAAALRAMAGRLERLSLRRAPSTGLDIAGPPLPDEALPADLPSAPAEARRAFRCAAAELRAAFAPGGAADDAMSAAIRLPERGRVRQLPLWAWPKLRANLTLRSTACRHALRQAALVTLATGLVWHFGIAFGYWVMLTIVMVTKPAYGGTRAAVGARMIGTVLGAAIAEMVLLGTQDFWLLAALALLFNCLSHAVITTHYPLGITLLTMYVIFKIDAAMPDTDVTLPRLLATLLGGALIAGSLLIWPPVRYASYWSGVGRSLRDLGKMLADLARDSTPGRQPGAMRDAAADAEQLASHSRMNLQNAEAIVREIFLEPAHWHPNRRELRSVVDGLHRLTGALAALQASGRSEAVPAAAMERSAALMTEMAAACSALDRRDRDPPPPAWPAELPQRARTATAALHAAPDAPLQALAAALRDLAEDLAQLARMRGTRSPALQPSAPEARG
ncbi:FUSC family protein [Marinibaculum pumilum]|uniref:FUSC family protein n=1 Tax=Marinibaculum pumilum TaxID=1766165 RepID=A0ABV7KU60_9PROT